MTREELLKIAKPILFNTEMVQAILEGRKTCSRRVIKPQAKKIYWNPSSYPNGWTDEHGYQRKEPYQIGDILYIRETFCEVPYEYEHIPMKNGHITVPKIAYRADSEIDYTGIWKPSIHMPKELARIFLKVTDVRVEKLQDITKDYSNFNKEGIKEEHGFRSEMHRDFIELWNSTVKKQDLDRYGWDANPWVWVIEFERVEEE